MVMSWNDPTDDILVAGFKIPFSRPPTHLTDNARIQDIHGINATMLQAEIQMAV